MLARIILVLFLSGCYELKSAATQSKVLLSRRYIHDILLNDPIEIQKKEKLRLVLRARQFARTLGLNVGRSYDTLSTKPARLWVLVAAKKDSLTPYTWQFPFVGEVPYKGFFSESEAKEFELDYPEYDTHIRTSSAFSSLGWFDDPVTPNLLELSDVELTETLFHELFHRTAWIPGSVSKNESAANFFGVMANIKFYDSDPERLKAAKTNLNRSLALSEDLTNLVNKLNKTFSDHTLSFEQKMLAKESLYKESGLPLTPNNAELLQLWIYFEYFKFYRDLFIKNNRSLPDFIKAFKDDTN